MSGGSLVAGLVLLGAALYGYFSADGPGVEVDQPGLLLDASAGQTLEVSFRVRNPTGHTARIVGLGEC